MSGSLRRRRWWILLASYLALLIASRAIEPPYERKPGPELEASSLPAVRGEAIERRPSYSLASLVSPGARAPPHRPPSWKSRLASRLRPIGPPLAQPGWTLTRPTYPASAHQPARPHYRLQRTPATSWSGSISSESSGARSASAWAAAWHSSSTVSRPSASPRSCCCRRSGWEMSCSTLPLNHVLHGAQLAALWFLHQRSSFQRADTLSARFPTRATSTTPIVHCAARSPRSSLRF